MIKKCRFLLRDLTALYVDHRVARSAAALSYYLTLSLFPFIIVLMSLLSMIDIDMEALSAMAEGVIPDGTLRMIGNYLSYIANNRSPHMLMAGLLLMVTMSSASFRTIMSAMEDIQGIPRYGGFRGVLVSFVFSIVFLVTIYISCIVIMFGDWSMHALEQISILSWITDIWPWARFGILFLTLYLVITAIYRALAPKEDNIPRSGGALIASLLLVAVSVIMSRIIDMSVRYKLVYGSLASITILMVWLYSCGVILIMGNAFNMSFSKFFSK